MIQKHNRDSQTYEDKSYRIIDFYEHAVKCRQQKLFE